MRTRVYLLAATLALLGACGDPTGPDLSAGADLSTNGSGASPTMDPTSLRNSH